jgi:hypothetical protein
MLNPVSGRYRLPRKKQVTCQAIEGKFAIAAMVYGMPLFDA